MGGQRNAVTSLACCQTINSHEEEQTGTCVSQNYDAMKEIKCKTILKTTAASNITLCFLLKSVNISYGKSATAKNKQLMHSRVETCYY